MAQPVPVVGDGEPAGFLGEGFLALQGLELVFFGDLGGDHLEDVVREPAERDRVVDGGKADQVRLRLGAVLDRERVDTLDDHDRLLFGDVAGGHRVPDRLVVAVQGVRELKATLGVPLGLEGLVGPVGCRCRWRRPRRPGRGVGVVGDPELELGDPVPQRGQRGKVSASVSLGQSTRVVGPRRWSRSAWRRRPGSDRVASGSPNTVAIQGILASATDNPGPRTGLGSGMWTTFLESFLERSLLWSRQARPPERPTTALRKPGGRPDPAPYLSPLLRLSTTRHLQPTHTRCSATAGASLNSLAQTSAAAGCCPRRTPS